MLMSMFPIVRLLKEMLTNIFLRTMNMSKETLLMFALILREMQINIYQRITKLQGEMPIICSDSETPQRNADKYLSTDNEHVQEP
eukprot:UN16552